MHQVQTTGDMITGIEEMITVTGGMRMQVEDPLTMTTTVVQENVAAAGDDAGQGTTSEDMVRDQVITTRKITTKV